MTPSELDEIWCVGSPGDHMYPKGISTELLVWLPRNGQLNILLFVIFSLPVTIQSIITWAFFEKRISPIYSSQNKLSFGIFNGFI